MKKYYTTKQIYKIDYLTTKKYYIPSIILMELAGKKVFDFISSKFSRKNKVLIFCGPGKNGGDGFVLARHLFVNGYKVVVVKFVKENEYQGDALLNLKILKRLKVKILDYRKLKRINRFDIIVDAIFGIGLNREISDAYLDAIKKINMSKKVVISVDIPSGINGDSGKIFNSAVRADYTLTIGFLKQGFKNKNIKTYLGKIIVLDIGYPEIDVE
ncbi:MAG: NAD(P)H-hydrate epimerase [Endomicrobiia bacterium]